MTTKLGVLAKVLTLVALLGAPAAAQNQAPARRTRRVRSVQLVSRAALPSSRASVPSRELRVCAAQRADQKATPSIEPEWPVTPPKDFQMVADARPLTRP